MESGCENEDDCDEEIKTLPLITLIKRIFTDRERLVQKKEEFTGKRVRFGRRRM